MISLRALEPDDLELLYQLENDTSLWSVSDTNVPYSHQLLRDFILRTTGDIYTDKQLRLMIVLGEEPIGTADLVNFNPQHLRAEVGITILPKYRQQGYATQALAQLLHYADTILHLHQLYAIVPADNPPSLHLFLRSGFTHTATLPDWLRTQHGFVAAELFSKELRS